MSEITRRGAIAAASGAIGVTLVTAPAEARTEEQQEQELQKGSEFIVKLNGIKLPADAEKRLAAAIQGAVMGELGRLDLPERNNLAVRFPLEWIGIWLDRVPQVRIPNLTTQSVPR